MRAPVQILLSYAEALGTMVVAGALAHWALGERRRCLLVEIAARVWGLVDSARRRLLVNQFCGARRVRLFLAIVLMAEILLAWHVARRMDYRATSASSGDVVAGDLVLFVMPLAISALALVKAGARLVSLLVGAGNLPACVGKCMAAALGADLLGYAALQVMNETFIAFGPRAGLDWWDARLWVYAGEYALSGVIVSAMMIANLLAVTLAAAGLGLVLIAAVLLQAELLAHIVARHPNRALLGGGISAAGLASVVKDWM